MALPILTAMQRVDWKANNILHNRYKKRPLANIESEYNYRRPKPVLSFNGPSSSNRNELQSNLYYRQQLASETNSCRLHSSSPQPLGSAAYRTASATSNRDFLSSEDFRSESCSLPTSRVELQNNGSKVDAGNPTGNENRRSKSASGVHLKRTSSRTSTVDELKVIKVNPDLVKYLEVNRSIREQWSPDRHYLDDGNCLQYKSKVKRSSSLSRPVSRWSNQSLIEEQTPAVSDSSTSSGKTTAICYSIDAETGNLRTKQIVSSDVVVIGINGEKRTSDEIFMTDKNLGSDNSDVIVSQTRRKGVIDRRNSGSSDGRFVPLSWDDQLLNCKAKVLTPRNPPDANAGTPSNTPSNSCQTKPVLFWNYSQDDSDPDSDDRSIEKLDSSIKMEKDFFLGSLRTPQKEDFVISSTFSAASVPQREDSIDLPGSDSDSDVLSKNSSMNIWEEKDPSDMCQSAEPLRNKTPGSQGKRTMLHFYKHPLSARSQTADKTDMLITGRAFKDFTPKQNDLQVLKTAPSSEGGKLKKSNDGQFFPKWKPKPDLKPTPITDLVQPISVETNSQNKKDEQTASLQESPAETVEDENRKRPQTVGIYSSKRRNSKSLSSKQNQSKCRSDVRSTSSVDGRLKSSNVEPQNLSEKMRVNGQEIKCLEIKTHEMWKPNDVMDKDSGESKDKVPNPKIGGQPSEGSRSRMVVRFSLPGNDDNQIAQKQMDVELNKNVNALQVVHLMPVQKVIITKSSNLDSEKKQYEFGQSPSPTLLMQSVAPPPSRSVSPYL